MSKLGKLIKYVVFGAGTAAVIKNRDKILDGIDKALDRGNEFLDKLNAKLDAKEEKESADNTENEEDFLRESFVEAEDTGSATLRRHLGKEIVVTGPWEHRTEERELDESELLPGEMYATVATVGCYRVRTAQRIYHGVGTADLSKPLEKLGTELTEMLTKLEKDTPFFSLRESGMTATYEISAAHTVRGTGFIPVCRTDRSTYTTWGESITYISTVKADISMQDEQASLFICIQDMGSSYSVNHWHRLSPDGITTEYQEHDMDPDSLEEHWEI